VFAPGKLPEVIKMPPTLRDIADYIREQHILHGKRSLGYLENAINAPKDGKQAIKSMMYNKGALEMCFQAYHIPYHLVTASKWQRAMGCPKEAGKGYTWKKNQHKQIAQRLFPHVKMIHAFADALLIGQYGVNNERK